MSKAIVFRISNFLSQFEKSIWQFFCNGNPPDACFAGVSLGDRGMPAESKFSLKDLIGNGILWAVPKHRRTVEKRLKRKYGHPDYVLKILLPRSNLRICIQCGHHHEAGVLCAHCYGKIRSETEQMQEKIQEKLGLNPVEEEVLVLYEGEKKEHSAEFLNGKRIIEMEKPRPTWFSKNLLQKSTQTETANTKEVKPHELG